MNIPAIIMGMRASNWAVTALVLVVFSIMTYRFMRHGDDARFWGLGIVMLMAGFNLLASDILVQSAIMQIDVPTAAWATKFFYNSLIMTGAITVIYPWVRDRFGALGFGLLLFLVFLVWVGATVTLAAVLGGGQ